MLLLLYVLLFARGLSWQWRQILSPGAGERPGPELVAVPVSQRGGAPVAPGPAQAQAPGARPARVPLAPSDAPPPRNATDEHGVAYDGAGVAVMGIDADTAGVYNVAPGRQLRIGGPTGQLFDVEPGGKLVPAARVKAWPE